MLKPGDPMPKVNYWWHCQLVMRILVVHHQIITSQTMILQRSKEPKIKTVKDVVNKGAKPADPMKGISAGEASKIRR